MKRIIYVITVLGFVILFSGCSVEESMDYMTAEKLSDEFSEDKIAALEKYEEGEIIHFRGVLLAPESFGSDVLICESGKLSSSITLISEDISLNEYLYRYVDFTAIFYTYNDSLFGVDIELELVEVLEVQDVEITLSLDDFNNLKQSEYYSFMGKVVTITGIFLERGWCSPSITNKDESFDIRIEVQDSMCIYHDDGDIIEVTGYLVDSDFDIPKLYTISANVIEEESP